MPPSPPILMLCLVCLLPAQAQAERDPAVVSVPMSPTTSLRGLAEHYLGDPDAWPEILRASGLRSVDQLRPGVQLRIPAEASRQLSEALGELRQLLYRATAAGALVFAEDLMTDAMSCQAVAVSARRAGSLAEASDQARQAIRAAAAALALSLENRDVPAEARLDDAGGRVERRRPNALDWTAVDIDALLAEEERLRTLAASFAVVRFRDASRIHMGEHSQLAIRRLREDRLTRREEVGVVLYGGDVRALLGAEAGRQSLNVTADGVETQAQSRSYWVQKTPDSARLSNFDGDVIVTAAGGAVTLGANQGTLVERSKPPLAPIDLLPAPDLTRPDDGADVFGVRAELGWSGVAGAAAYWVEVARDPDFAQLVFTETRVSGQGVGVPLGGEGLYYWRVSAIDSAGLPGPAAPARQFRKLQDQSPPYLLVRRPTVGYRTDDPELRIAGRTEIGATLSLDGAAVAVGPDGHFQGSVRLAPGLNRLSFEARDPAGNVQRLERLVRLRSEDALQLSLAPETARDDAGHLLTNRPWMPLTGEAPPGSSIRITSPDVSAFVAAGLADEAGRFALTLRLESHSTRFELTVESPAGQRRREPFTVILDQAPPAIRLTPEPPYRSAESRLVLAGQLEGGEQLSLGGLPVPLLPDGRFSLELALRPGANRLTLLARDQAGNLSRWEQNVLLDQEPPRLVGYRLEDEAGEGAQHTLTVEIDATDDSGVIATLPYRVRAGALVQEGIARRCADRACYRDRLVLPAASARQARLSAVVLQDYLGNRQEVDLD